ncbi:hypothetical protein PGT21_002973 [Puccinia graminis f. sp. tritici]|uniref:Uncharacterized protein n=1 Tax=Puccinia graminis f. sp. tritici TaxID=56615 RepID=A0A5B0PT63_PUCGR|nr:hypothetical protein PGTUg99_015526 [Puccinia graminis f. sp. tritici]KAA1103862.1 hypothetical protein PGT21_002973 [Puccinia graminis f. sp. tritici]
MSDLHPSLVQSRNAIIKITPEHVGSSSSTYYVLAHGLGGPLGLHETIQSLSSNKLRNRYASMEEATIHLAGLLSCSNSMYMRITFGPSMFAAGRRVRWIPGEVQNPPYRLNAQTDVRVHANLLRARRPWCIPAGGHIYVFLSASGLLAGANIAAASPRLTHTSPLIELQHQVNKKKPLVERTTACAVHMDMADLKADAHDFSKSGQLLRMIVNRARLLC